MRAAAKSQYYTQTRHVEQVVILRLLMSWSRGSNAIRVPRTKMFHAPCFGSYHHRQPDAKHPKEELQQLHRVHHAKGLSVHQGLDL